MAYNIPDYTTKDFSFGPGVLRIGATATTPMTDIGACRGAVLHISRGVLAVMQGSPAVEVKRYAISEEVSIELEGIEWNLDNIAFALGTGTTTHVGFTDTLALGGDMEFAEKALLYRHIQPDGSTIDICLYQVQPDPTLDIDFKNEPHTFPYKFFAQEATSDFENAALAAKQKLMKITRVRA